MKQSIKVLVSTVLLSAAAGTALAGETKITQKVKAPADGYDIFILMGQSNADGRGSAKLVPKEYASPSADHIIFYHGLASTPDWMPLSPGFASRTDKYTFPNNFFGVEVTFAPALAEAMPGMKTAIIKSSRGSTGMGQWSGGSDAMGEKGQKPGSCYRMAMEAVNRAIAKLPPGEHRLRGILWHQGENDAGDANYDKKVVALANRFRNDLKAPGLPFVLGGLRPGIGGKWNTVAARAAELDPNIAFASSEGLGGDSLHFNSEALLEFGKRYATAMTPLIKKAKPTVIKGGTTNYTLYDSEAATKPVAEQKK